MAEEGAAAGMEIDTAVPQPQQPTAPAVPENKAKPRFEIKKYNAVALWAWGTCFGSHSLLFYFEGVPWQCSFPKADFPFMFC